jgi:hypothetical protein
MLKRFYLIFFLGIFILILEGEQAFAGGVVQGWVRRWPQTAGDDVARAIAVGRLSGNVCVTGSYFQGPYGLDWETILYRPDGNGLWSEDWRVWLNANDSAFAVAIDDSDNVYVTGGGYLSSSTDLDYHILKIPLPPTPPRARSYSGLAAGSMDVAYALAVDQHHNVYVTGRSGVSQSDYATIKCDADLNQLWVARYNGTGDSNDVATAITVDASGNVYVTGYSWNGSNYDYATVKYDSLGGQVWVRTYNGTGDSDDKAYDITLDGFGNIYVTGGSRGLGTGYDYLTIKYDASGNPQWNNRYFPAGGNVDDVAKAIAVNNSNNVYVTGKVQESSGNYGTIKYSSSGTLLWDRLYDGPVNGDDGAVDIAVDDFDNVYVTGYSQNTDQNYDYVTLRYNSDGSKSWERRYNGPGNGDDVANAITLFDSCNIYVTGYSTGIGTGHDYTTIKYTCSQSFPTFPLIFISWGPVLLTVTDPVGDSIGLGFNTIGNGSSYNTSVNLDSVHIPSPIIGDYQIRVTNSAMFRAPTTYKVGVRIDGNDMTLLKNNENTPPPGESDTLNYNTLPHLRGDVNGDEVQDIGDIVYLINYVFYGGPAPNPIELGDANCDTVVDIGDIVHLINYVFYQGIPPCS